jgi:hypothetical protein
LYWLQKIRPVIRRPVHVIRYRVRLHPVSRHIVRKEFQGLLGRGVRIEPLSFHTLAQDNRHAIVDRSHELVWFRRDDGKRADRLAAQFVFFVQTGERKRLAAFQSNVVWGFVPLLPFPLSYVDTSSLLNLNPTTSPKQKVRYNKGALPILNVSHFYSYFAIVPVLYHRPVLFNRRSLFQYGMSLNMGTYLQGGVSLKARVWVDLEK